MQPAATLAPFCAAMDAPLGSIQLDYDKPAGSPSVSEGEAEAIARTTAGIPDTVTTCSVRLARYRNVSVEVDRVWVVHFDGLSWPALSGPLPLDGRPPAPPRTLRRALFIVSADAPAKMLVSVASGP